MSAIVRADRAAGGPRPNRISIWPTEDERYGLDFTYHGATGYADAEHAEALLDGAGLRTTFRQELDGAWSVRRGPVPPPAMLEVLSRFAL